MYLLLQRLYFVAWVAGKLASLQDWGQEVSSAFSSPSPPLPQYLLKSVCEDASQHLRLFSCSTAPLLLSVFVAGVSMKVNLC